MKTYIIFLLVNVSILFVGCTSSNNKEKINSDEKFDEAILEPQTEKGSILKDAKNEDVVFYNLFSPLDLNKVIEQKSAFYNSSYVNSLNNINKYESSQKIALNIGIYGADLSYLWMFDQKQQAVSYLSAIQHLTTKLGIPKSFVETTFKDAETNSKEIDSLISIARVAYSTTNIYLKESGRESAAVLILLGGWIESLNIALNMYTTTDSKLAGKIISQKYSLNTLINMVQNIQDNLVMSEYLLLLKKQNDAFNNVELQFKADDIFIDTVNKRISVKDTYNAKIDPKHFSELKALTFKIREHIIE